MSDGFSIVQRVRFGDLDAMQHMNNVEFLRFFETARIDWFGEALPGHAPGSRQAFGFIFAECHIAYRAPAFFGDEIRTWIKPLEMKRSSIRLGFEMRVGETIAHWEEGKTLLFDDTFEHEVWNDTDGLRVVLFMDVLRPLPFFVGLLNRTIIKAIAASPFVRDAKKNYEAWEQRMSQLWN